MLQKVTLGKLQSHVKCSRVKGLSEQVTPLLPHPPSVGRSRPRPGERDAPGAVGLTCSPKSMAMLVMPRGTRNRIRGQ